MRTGRSIGDPAATRRGKRVADGLGARGVALVALTYVDNSGIARVKGVPVDRLADAAAWGVGMSPVFDAFLFDDSITSSPSAGGPVGDLRLVPDLDRLVALAAQPGWAWAPVDRWEQSGVVHAQCQRSFVRRMVDRLADHDLRAEMAFEVEWMVSPPGTDEFEPATTGPAYGSARAVELSDYCVELTESLSAQGIDVDQLHPEYAAGQFEVSIGHADPLTAADDNVLVRQTIRAVSQHHGLRPTFAPVVAAGGVGNGMHVHFSLWHGDHNESLDSDGVHGLAQGTEAFLAGTLGALPELLAVTAPSVASYLRLQPQHWSAPFQCWGVENREAALRVIPGSIARHGATANAEIKVIDATASPYLVVGSLLAAGVAGLERSATLPDALDVDPGTLSGAELAARGIERLPSSLRDAADRFAESELLVDAMGTELHETILAIRRAECELFAGRDDDDVVAATRWRH